jgi:hypothetical protein
MRSHAAYDSLRFVAQYTVSRYISVLCFKIIHALMCSVKFLYKRYCCSEDLRDTVTC